MSSSKKDFAWSRLSNWYSRTSTILRSEPTQQCRAPCANPYWVSILRRSLASVLSFDASSRDRPPFVQSLVQLREPLGAATRYPGRSPVCRALTGAVAEALGAPLWLLPDEAATPDGPGLGLLPAGRARSPRRRSGP